VVPPTTKVVAVEHTMMPPGGLKTTDGYSREFGLDSMGAVLNVFTASRAIYCTAALRARSW
jgi:hypothetical protein